MLVNKHGAIVALDPNNGEILALATGKHRPKSFYRFQQKRNIYRLANDTIYDNKPTYDRSVQAAYPPGSPFKLLTALAGYQMKVISDSTKFTCRHGYRMGRHTIGCHCGTRYIGMEKP